jgi:hypothetical protein
MFEPSIYENGRAHYEDLLRKAEAALRHPPRRPTRQRVDLLSAVRALVALILGTR